MDSWNSFYEPCELTIDIECTELPQEIERALEASLYPTEPELPRRQRQSIRPSRELRLNLRSPQLKERFKRIVEDDVPGRKTEAGRIFNFITSAENGNSSPLCLYGNTGCGKTSLITKVIEFFEHNSTTVSVAYLNCMSIRTVNLIYVYLIERFYGGKKGIRGGRAAEVLRKCLIEGIGPEQPTKIVVLDEIDHVIGEQNFLYNMLEWLNIGAKLVLVLISNVIDLAVRLDGKLQSRWKFETIIFHPYSCSEIEFIIRHKYQNIGELCRRDAIIFIAKRIFNINSDIRTLDKIYNRIVATAGVGNGQLLDIESVQSLIYDENKTPSMQNSYDIVATILHEGVKRSEVSDLIFQRLYKEGRRNPKKQEVLLILCDLQDAGLITLTSTRKNYDISYNDYGIKVHENLRLYIENNDR